MVWQVPIIISIQYLKSNWEGNGLQVTCKFSLPNGCDGISVIIRNNHTIWNNNNRFVETTLNEMSGTERLVQSHHDLQNFHSKATSKRATDLLRMRNMTYPSLPVNSFSYQPQIIFRGLGHWYFTVCSQIRPVDSPTPWWNISILTHHKTWNNKEFKEFSTSFASSKQ